MFFGLGGGGERRTPPHLQVLGHVRKVTGTSAHRAEEALGGKLRQEGGR